MKKYKVYSVFCGCKCDERIVDTLEEAKELEKIMDKNYIDEAGEENYYSGNGDFCTYITAIEVENDES